MTASISFRVIGSGNVFTGTPRGFKTMVIGKTTFRAFLSLPDSFVDQVAAYMLSSD